MEQVIDTWQYTPFIWFYLFAVGVSFFSSVVGWRMRPARGAIHFSMLALATGFWSLGYLLGFFNTQLGWKLAMLRIEYFGMISTNFFWIIFIAVYVYYDHYLTKRALLILGIVPIITFIQILTIQHHTLFYRFFDLTNEAGLILFTKEYGPGFYLWAGFAYLIFPFGGLILILGILRMPRHLKLQAIPITLAVFLCLLFNFSYISGNNPIAPYDPTPLAVAITGVLFLIIMRRYKFLNIVPVAYNRLFQNINTGVIIVDVRAKILDMNLAAEKVTKQKQKDVLGKHILDVLPEYAELVDDLDNMAEIHTEIQLGDEDHFFELQTKSLAFQTGDPVGHIIMLFDISKRKWMASEQARLINELKEKNVRLSKALEEIKTLQGIIPICASCKKVRDDQGYWNQLEAYLEKNSDASLTHGICPECSEKLYGDHRWYVEMKKRKDTE